MVGLLNMQSQNNKDKNLDEILKTKERIFLQKDMSQH